MALEARHRAVAKATLGTFVFTRLNRADLTVCGCGHWLAEWICVSNGGNFEVSKKFQLCRADLRRFLQLITRTKSSKYSRFSS